ncbi:MAG TPA: alkyl hydroperoxide reductase [Verrucomicrobia subdivision 3 bacterium]|nr:alkyl hydroperoxide reductase [Limisphaerales bacterium]
MRSAGQRPAVFLAVIVMTMLTAGSWGRCAETNNSAPPSALAKTAPDFALTDLSGKTVRLSDFKGKVVLLDFWATWCGPCRKEIPDLIQLQTQYAEQGFTILGIALDEEGAAVVKPLAQRMGINYPLVIGTTQATDAYGGIQAVPTTLLIGRDGRILKTYLGARDKSEFQRDIQSALQHTSAAAK